eukprot:7381085-Prymnesium_polylepis.1
MAICSRVPPGAARVENPGEDPPRSGYEDPGSYPTRRPRGHEDPASYPALRPKPEPNPARMCMTNLRPYERMIAICLRSPPKLRVWSATGEGPLCQ